MALTWKSKRKCGNDLTDHQLVQSTYQYVSLYGKIGSLFKNDSFHKSYFDFNENHKHICTDDMYEGFCCGSIYKQHAIFEPTTIQLQLGIDEFEPCNALKTKAGLHKMYAIYFQINNIDPMIKSKLGNIHLVALAKSTDLKAGDVDKIANKIVEELKLLESEGITIKSGRNLKAILTNICSDNLGANSTFGFVECFNARYFCRICELTSAECKSTTVEMPSKLRQKQSYAGVVDFLNENENGKIDYKATRGIKKACVFNKLAYFHILDNCTVDIMHDLNEGVIPFFIQFIFDTIIAKKIASLNEIQSLCRDYDYGYIWNKYKPSAVKFEKTRLNQNAMQAYCLILHLPFILYKLKDKLQSEWSAMEVLLQFLQIVFSLKVRKSDIERLRNLSKEHLEYLIERGLSILPKHHNTTHYARLFEIIGPLIHSWMMRYESKHKLSTDLVHLTYNYKNLPLTLAKRHEARACLSQDKLFMVEIVASKMSYDLSRCNDYDTFKSHLPNVQTGQIKAIKFVRVGTREYRAGLMLIEEKNVPEILHVIFLNSKYYVLCLKYNVLGFVSSLNSIEIEKDNVFQLVDISNVKSHKSYEKTSLNNRMFIIADTLSVFDEF